MGKIVTSSGLQEFIQAGKVEEIKSDAPKKVTEAPPLEVKPDKVAVDIGQTDAVDQHVEEDPETLAEIEKSERFRRTINKKHRAMKEAQEDAAKAKADAAESDRFAENQYNRAQLAERRAAELEAQVKVKPEPKPEAVKPDPKSFYEGDQFKAFEYAEALSKFAATEAVVADRARQAEERREAEAAEQQRLAMARIETAKKAHPDYDRVTAAAGDVKVHNIVLEYMTGSEQIGEIAYHMAKNPDFVARINKLHPLKAIAEIGKLEQTFEAPKAVEPPVSKAPGAPPPIAPLVTSGSGTVQTDPAKMGTKELRAYERERAIFKAKHGNR